MSSRFYNLVKMKSVVLTFFLIAFFHAAANSTYNNNFIVTKKVTPSYWHATFSCPPLHIQGLAFFQDYYALIDQSKLIATSRS